VEEIHCEDVPPPTPQAKPVDVVVRTYPGIGAEPGRVMFETVRLETLENNVFEVFD
jgi:hypothetical protein